MTNKDIAYKILGVKPAEKQKDEPLDKVDILTLQVLDLVDMMKVTDPNFGEIKNSLAELATSIVNIPKQEKVDLSGIQEALDALASVEQKEMDLSAITDTLNTVVLKLSSMKTQVPAPIIVQANNEKLIPEFSKLGLLIKLLTNKIPTFDYNKLEKIIKDNLRINVQGGGGYSEFVRDKDGKLIYPAIKENQNQYQKAGTTTNEPNKGYAGAQFSMKYTEAIMRGLIPGASSSSAGGYYVASAPVTTFTPLATGGVCNIAPTGGIQMSIVSTSVQDGVAGTGIRTLAIGYIEDGTLLAKTEIVTMNGTTPVLTIATNIRFINTITRLTADGVTTFGGAIGTITIKNGAGTIIYGQLDPGQRIQASSFRMIPAGKVFYPFTIIASSNSATAASQAIFCISQWSPSLPYFTPANFVGEQDGAVDIALEAGRGIPAGTVVGIEFTASKASTLTGTIIGVLENA